MAPPAFFSMSFWSPSTQEDAPHEGPHHLLWAPPRRLRHTPSPAGAGPSGSPESSLLPGCHLGDGPMGPRVTPRPCPSLRSLLEACEYPAPLSCAGTLQPMPSPCLCPQASSPSLPPASPQPPCLQSFPELSLPAPQSQGPPGPAWSLACRVLHPSQPLRFPGLTSLFSTTVPLHIYFLCGDSQRSLFSNLLNPPLAMLSSSFFCDSLAPIAMASETF